MSTGMIVLACWMSMAFGIGIGMVLAAMLRDDL